MEIQDFVRIPEQVIREDGFEDFLPVLCLPEKREIRGLAGVPDCEGQELRRIMLDWAEKETEPDDEFLLAFKEDSEHLRIVRRCGGRYEEQVFPVKTA